MQLVSAATDNVQSVTGKERGQSLTLTFSCHYVLLIDSCKHLELLPQMVASPARAGIVVLSPEYVCRAWPMRELRIFEQKTQDKKEKFLLLPVFLRLTAGQTSELADLYRSNDYKALLADKVPEEDWAALAANVAKHTGVRPEQVRYITHAFGYTWRAN